MAFGLGPALHSGDGTGDLAALVEEIAGASRLVTVRQVHAGRVLKVRAADLRSGGSSCAGTADGLLTRDAGVVLVIRTADCVPVLLAAGDAVAAAHAGWRGAAAGILPATLQALAAGGTLAATLRVALGPAIGPCHYPVGEEVVSALADTGVPRQTWLRGDRVDLRSFLRSQLERSGVPASRIELVGGCTCCSPELASFRRDGRAAGRQLSLVWRAVAAPPRS